MEDEVRLQKEGLLARARRKLQELEVRIERYRTDVATAMFPAEAFGIKGVERNKAKQAFGDWESAIEEYEETEENIKRLEKELGLR